jgi:hypothetical protein
MEKSRGKTLCEEGPSVRLTKCSFLFTMSTNRSVLRDFSQNLRKEGRVSSLRYKAHVIHLRWAYVRCFTQATMHVEIRLGDLVSLDLRHLRLLSLEEQML